MTLADPRERALKAELAALRKERRKARPAKVVPTAEGQRQPRKREPLYLAWIRRLPCIAGLIIGGCDGPIQAAHLRMGGAGRRNPGMGAKPDDRLSLPLCAHHHLNDQHRGSEAAFWARLCVDPGDLCGALGAAYDADTPGIEVINQFAYLEDVI